MRKKRSHMVKNEVKKKRRQKYAQLSEDGSNRQLSRRFP